MCFFFFQAEDGIRDLTVTGVQTCALPISGKSLQAYRDQSPISYVATMKTPTLILSDVRDARVTVTQSYELYHALRDNGVPVRFVAYPVDGHFPGDPVRTTDVYRRWLEWLDQDLKGPVSSR